jgi:hypothetical protein
MASFESIAAAFSRFAVSQGCQPNLLWVKSEDVVFGRWLGRWVHFVWKGDPGDRLRMAQIGFESAMARKIGVAFEAKCRTDRWTICRVYVPADDRDAQQRLIPQAGVKQNIALEPLPAILVESKALWLFLKWTLTTKQTVFD